jgi:hypothetical protein
MAEIRTVTTLRRKRDEVRKAVRKYERCLDQARADLTHLIAAIAIFEAKGGDDSLPAYADLHRLFRYGEAFRRSSLSGHWPRGIPSSGSNSTPSASPSARR